MEKELTFDEFEKTNYDDWKKLAESTLKGASFDKKLISKTIEKIDIQPLYQDDSANIQIEVSEFPGFAPFNRSISVGSYKNEPWLISQELSSTSTAEFNHKVINALKNGLEAVYININTPDSSLNIRTPEDLESCFDKVDITSLYLIINAGQDFETILRPIKAHCEKFNIPSKEIKASVLIDPVRDLSLYGSLPDKFENIIQNISKTLSDYSKVFPGIKLIGVDSTIFHNAGASAVQELAISIAIGTEYLRQLINLGHDPEDIIKHFHFTTSVSSNFFMEIAKIKAHRVLWNTITNEFGISSHNRGSYIEAQNSLINKSMLDKHSNILRSTGETMASILGGANIINTFRFDGLDNGGSDFGDRIARNIQLVLRHEAHLLDTIDPAGGTWFIDNLLNEISLNSWDFFRDIESRGGIVQCLRDGYIQDILSSTLAARISSYHTRKESLLGVNIFANTLESLNLETPHTKIENQQIDMNSAEIIKPVLPCRFAEDFEIFRSSVNEKSKTMGELIVFIANFGKASEYAARMDFSSDFFRLGGFTVVNGNQYEMDTDGIAQAINDMSDRGSKAMVICSSDSNYPIFVNELAKEFKKSNSDSMLILAGYPSEYVEQFSASGVDEFIHIKSDILEQLKKVLNKY